MISEMSRLVSGNPDTLVSDGVFDTGEILVRESLLYKL